MGGCCAPRRRPDRPWSAAALLALCGLLSTGAGCAAAPGGEAAGAGAAGVGGRQAGRPQDEARPGRARADDARRAVAHLPGGRTCVLEIADTERSREVGYMHRTRVGEEEGMIFVFPRSDFHSFWMRNTLVPLDIIWMDGDFTVFHIEHEVPPCRADPCPSYGPVRKARYVLEVRGGMARREGLKSGDRLRIAFPEPVP